MKKFLLVLLILLLAFGGFVLYDVKFKEEIPKLVTEEEAITIDELYVYGTHFNLHGSLVNDNNLQLVLYDGEFREYEINLNDSGFNLSNLVNEGIYLEEIPVGNYYMFLRSKNNNEDGDEIYKYYRLDNTTEYKDTVYYTFSNVGNKIVINSDSEYNTLMMSVMKNTDKDIYDIVIDPGHGGMDGGASKNGYKESDFTMKIALSLKEKLEKFGLTVKLTYDEGQLSTNEKLNDYGSHGRAVVSSEVNAKYLFSIHMNSNTYASVNGLEIYTAGNINYDFAKLLAKNITNGAGISYSSNKINKKFDGVYTRLFTEDNINSSRDDYIKKELNPYDISTKSNYYYMIRETGGIVTGAYVDDRNEEITGNPYVKNNVGTEAYLLELGYISNKGDLDNMINNMEKYADAIASTVKTLYLGDGENSENVNSTGNDDNDGENGDNS